MAGSVRIEMRNWKEGLEVQVSIAEAESRKPALLLRCEVPFARPNLEILFQ
jgi:hypothetical protein